jgi:metal-dependent hydrolase (beta-lactamase superfamily II)
MKFTALPVKVGDAFLLETTEKHTILVDGGMNQSHIIQLLNNQKIKNNHINLLVCTHYDADHLNGIIGVLKSKYTFDEIWLPEMFGSIAFTIAKKLESIIAYYFNEEFALDNIKDYELPIYEDTIENDVYDNESNYEEIDTELLDYFESISLRALTYGHRFPFYSKFENHINLAINSKKISSLVSTASKSGSHIRWLKYVGKRTNIPIAYNMFSENSIQSKCQIYDPSQFFKMLYLSTQNKYSLVFRYNNRSTPEVLFTADSDLSFLNNAVTLRDKSIVTAPIMVLLIMTQLITKSMDQR